MLNRIQFEGIALKTWAYGQDQFIRLLHRPDPGQNDSDILMTVKLPAAMPLDVKRGDLLRMHGYLDNRKVDGDNGNENYIAEIIPDSFIRLGRGRLNRGNPSASAEKEEKGE